MGKERGGGGASVKNVRERKGGGGGDSLKMKDFEQHQRKSAQIITIRIPPFPRVTQKKRELPQLTKLVNKT